MSFQVKLLQWFEKNKRPLPWRKDYQPYHVWVSEMMLQQTQMSTVLPYFDRWIKTFPTVESLAHADEQKVLKLWQGLGYYARARNLHKGAKKIMADFDGKFPSDFVQIQSIKGIGPYSAGAIASIAFNQPKPIVDGNILRVLSRIYAISKPIDVMQNRSFFWSLQENLIPKENPRDFNQGLMELGALICTPANPACPLCPVKDFCKAYAQKNAEAYPVKIKKKALVKVHAAAVILENNQKFYLHYRPLGEIMGGLWEFPEWKLAKNKTLTETQIKNQLQKIIKKEFGVESLNLRHKGRIKRNYTHHLETLEVYHVPDAKMTKSESNWEADWVSKKDFSKHPFSSAHAKIADLLK